MTGVWCRNGEDEYMNSVIQEQPAMKRTLLSAAAGGIVVLCCTALCWLCGNDPAGVVISD